MAMRFVEMTLINAKKTGMHNFRIPYKQVVRIEKEIIQPWSVSACVEFYVCRFHKMAQLVDTGLQKVKLPSAYCCTNCLKVRRNVFALQEKMCTVHFEAAVPVRRHQHMFTCS